MNDPNAPDSRDWEAIDIYLFSNGQQYSPPRKYHLRADELKWWDGTLNYLAHSQYGNRHSNIELYTLDGKKIESPLELTHTAAYVAVEPPDDFIQAGYDRYLIKASRSWEKRQEKLLNNTEVIKTDENGIMNVESSPKLNIIIAELKTIDENLIGNVDTTVGLPKPPVMSENKKPQNVFQMSPKHTNKNNSSKTEKSAILKKNNNNYIKKNMHESKVLPKMAKPNIKSIPNKRQSIISKYTRPSIIKTTGKVQSKIKLEINNTTDEKIKINEISVNNSPKQDILNESVRNSVTKSEKTETVTNLFRNTDNEIQSILAEDIDQITLPSNNKQNNEPVYSKKVSDLYDTFVNSNRKESKNNLNNCSDTEASENATTVLNKKGVLNVNLKIDFCNFLLNNNIKEPHDASSVKKMNSFISLAKASQVNIDIKVNAFENSPPIYKYLDANVLKDVETNGLHNNSKLVIVHCAYDNLENEKTTQDYLINKDYLVILPMPINDEISKSCRCNEKIILNRSRNASTIKINSKIHITSSNTDKEMPILTEDQTQMDIIVLPDSQKNVQIAEKDLSRNKYTQTEWCNILFEAKFHDDGRYSFYLPSLQFLKQHDVLWI